MLSSRLSLCLSLALSVSAVASVLGAPDTCSDTNLQKSGKIGVGRLPQEMATGDFNQDGKLDLVVANFSSNSVSVIPNALINNPNAQVEKIELATGSGPLSVAVGDFNHDGLSDIAVGTYWGHAVTIFAGNGAFSFKPANRIPIADYVSAITVGDFNGDGNEDLGVALVNGFVFVANGYGNGDFSPYEHLMTAPDPRGLVAVKTAGFGYDQLAVTDFQGDLKIGYRENSNNSDVSQQLFEPGTGALAAGDLNGDGNSDLVFLNERTNRLTSVIKYAYLNLGEVTNYDLPSSPRAVELADFNNDGKLDVSILDETNTISIMPGDGNGKFGKAIIFSVGAGDAYARFVATGDFNGDRKTDLSVSGQLSGDVSVLINTTITNAACDTLDTPPTVTGSSISLVQGGRQSWVVLAASSDVQTAASDLKGSVLSAPFGVAVLGIQNVNGNIHGDIWTDCSARLGEQEILINVTDATGHSSIAKFILTITENASPTVGNYSSVVLPKGSSVVARPDASPSDDFFVSDVKVVAPGFDGQFSVEAGTGAVSLRNAQTPGVYNVAVVVTDNCGRQGAKFFSVRVE